jgi:hypothetical protein
MPRGTVFAVPKPERLNKDGTPKKKGGISPRKAGSRVEKIVADKLGEQRTVGSGAFKQSNKNLTGDIDVHDHEGRDFIKLEVKMTGRIDTSGAKSFILTEKVLNQMQEEAEAAKELGALVIHFKGGKQYVCMPFEHWQQLLELAKLGRSMQK